MTRPRGDRAGSRREAGAPRRRIPTERARARERECGAAAVLVVAVIGVLAALTAAALVLAGAVTASHRARLAADLAALAGARHLQTAVSAETACSEARRVAALNQAELGACLVEGMDLEVTVLVPTGTWPTPASARARAGPYRESSTPTTP